MKKKKISKILGIVVIDLMLIYIGFILGMVYQQILFTISVEKIAEGLEGTNFNINVDFNETLMVDRTTNNLKDIMWEIQMQNCSKTQKGYCAVRCYENKKLIPCNEFTGDEHFCNNGICEMNGISPDYFERLDGKTTEDCIKEIEK
ncbi:MAG: hypothetical protein M0R17_05735 [Candidatus Omnitrophica bacterium]|jgi:hypothetical protein|nr:hypothetical protein [Candidatus Omnitrophota bacterium]